MSNVFYIESPYLSHHGVKGQKWGIRRYQNPNGTLTALGKKRVRKAMKLHDKIMGARGDHDYRKASKKFTKYSRKLYSGETTELIKQIQKDNELRSLYEEKKSEEGRRRIEQGLKYTEQAAKILSSGMMMYSTYQQAKNWKAQAEYNKAQAENAKGQAENWRAQAETNRAKADYNRAVAEGKWDEVKPNKPKEEPKIQWYDMPSSKTTSTSNKATSNKANSNNMKNNKAANEWSKKATETAKQVVGDAFNDWASGKNEYSGGFKQTEKQKQYSSSGSNYYTSSGSGSKVYTSSMADTILSNSYKSTGEKYSSAADTILFNSYKSTGEKYKK